MMVTEVAPAALRGRTYRTRRARRMMRTVWFEEVAVRKMAGCRSRRDRDPAVAVRGCTGEGVPGVHLHDPRSGKGSRGLRLDIRSSRAAGELGSSSRPWRRSTTDAPAAIGSASKRRGPRCPEARASGLAGRRFLALSWSALAVLGRQCRTSTPATWSRHRAIDGRDRSADVVRADRRILTWFGIMGAPAFQPLDCARAMVRVALHLPRPVCDEHGRDNRGFGAGKPGSTSMTRRRRSAASQAPRRTPRPGQARCASVSTLLTLAAGLFR